MKDTEGQRINLYFFIKIDIIFLSFLFTGPRKPNRIRKSDLITESKILVRKFCRDLAEDILEDVMKFHQTRGLAVVTSHTSEVSPSFLLVLFSYSVIV